MFSLASEVEYEAGPVNLKGRSAVQSATLHGFLPVLWKLGCLERLHKENLLILVTFNWHLQAKELPEVFSRRP